jgi:biopolymer transport protein ExbD
VLVLLVIFIITTSDDSAVAVLEPVAKSPEEPEPLFRS